MIDRCNEDTLLLLNTLIKTRSDSATHYEKNIENVILDEIKNNAYFKQHDDHYGLSKIPNDPYDRSVVWAISHRRAPKTVILFGHHDAVDLTAYGTLNGLDPTELLNHFKVQNGTLSSDVLNGDWLFGRGSCDMKAGLAINLSYLKKATEVDLGVNILFLSVPDEETQSAGMRHAVHLLLNLRKEFELTYEIAILTEPHDRATPNQFTITTGSVGKMMPVILTKGMPSHSGVAYSGLNSISIAMEIIKAIELNTEMGDSINKRMTPPPAFLSLYSIKETYDVTTPEFTVAYFNWLYLKGNLTGKFEQLRELCKWSVEDAINQFNYSYNEFLRKQALPSYRECMDFEFEILLYDELVELVRPLVDVEALYQKLKNENPLMPAQELTVLLMTQLVSVLDAHYPIIVIGLLPPFYPVVDSDAYFDSVLRESVESKLNALDLSLVKDNYFMGISDMSYMKKMSHDPKSILKHMPLLDKMYCLDFDAISDLDIDVLHIGPWGKDLHQKTERVLIKDVTETVPALIQTVVETISKKR